MTEQTWFTMTGWRKREMQAKARERQKTAMADIRAARKANRLREAGHDPGEAEVQPVAPAKPREGDTTTVAPDYPNPDEMDRDALFAYLKAHGVNPGPATKDDTLRRKVQEVRDGHAETA